MKKLIIVVSMVLACSFAYAQENTRQTQIMDGNTLYIVDGILSRKLAVDELPSDAIKSMNIVKGIEKAVIITTREGKVISGRVVDVDGKPMNGVVVRVSKTQNVAVTDKQGFYEINLPVGKEFIDFRYGDYPTKTVQVNKENMDDVVMDKNAPQNSEVIKDLKGDVVSVRGEKKPAGDPLCIIKKSNGELSKGKLDSLTPDDIKSIHVFKDSHVDDYKEFGDVSNGVILVELK